ncbi:MAG: gamma-glutamyl-gamma-aminobutyrate hydrolase family protein [Granulicella sp.]
MSKPRIAIPFLSSDDLLYNQECWPVYATAIERAGGEPVEFAPNLTPSEIANLASTCQGVLLPGSHADVNPQKYGQELDPSTGPIDLARENVDELLLQDAHNLYKPLLCICYGTQSLNVWRGGTLIQDVTPLPVNHRAGRAVAIAHTVAIAPDSVLGKLTTPAEAPVQDDFQRLPTNSSHHQAIGIPGDGLRVAARCPQDGVIEAVEGGQSPENGADHFVLALQWHPERSYEISPASKAIFARLIHEASEWTPRAVHTSIG